MGRPLTLALGGGGARGLAHLGVIDVLTKAGFDVQRIAGISMGSLVGGMFAFDPHIERVISKALRYLLSPAFQKHQQTLFGYSGNPQGDQTYGLFSWYAQIQKYLRANRMFHRAVTQPGMLPGVILQDVVNQLLIEADLGDARIPLVVVAADLRSGHVAIIEKGSLRDAVRGSAALPGIFPPIPFGEMQLCDCGNFLTLPTSVARSYTEGFVVGVEVSAEVQPLDHCETAIDALVRVDEIGENFWRKQVRSAANVLIRPNVAHAQWYDFSAAESIIELGRKAANNAMGEIEAAWAKMSHGHVS